MPRLSRKLYLYSMVFENSPKKYKRLAAVLAKSAALNCPNVPFEMMVTGSDIGLRTNTIKHRQWLVDNSRKSKHQNNLIQEAPNGKLIGLLDCDMMILRDLSDIGKQDFDLAYTIRPRTAPYLLNSGVIFVRVSPRMKEFFAAWYATVRRMLSNSDFFIAWNRRFGGINQSALGFMLSEQSEGIHKLELRCEEWNQVSTDWDLESHPRIIHVLAKLRRLVLGESRVPTDLSPIIKEWKRIESLI